VFDASVRGFLAVAALLTLAAGCGGAENEPSLAAAADRTEAAGSSALAVAGVRTLGTRSETFTCEGVADYATRRMQLSCGDAGEIVVIGDDYYVNGWPGLVGAPPGKAWTRIPVAAGASSPHDLAPTTVLSTLRAASVDTERVGDDTVRGTETVRYRMTVRCDEADLDCPGETADADVWLDDDGRVRRVLLEDAGVEVTAEFFDFGVDVDVQGPPAEDTGDLTAPSFEGCAGGGAPISERRFGRALREHGFVISSGDRCLTGVVAQVAAILEPADAGQQGASVFLCHVHRGAWATTPSGVREDERRGVVGVSLRNVVCSSTTKNPDVTGVRRLRTALGELERELGP